jgi:hypothetical protein
MAARLQKVMEGHPTTICPLRPFDFYPNFTNGTGSPSAFTDLFGLGPIICAD